MHDSAVDGDSGSGVGRVSPELSLEKVAAFNRRCPNSGEPALTVGLDGCKVVPEVTVIAAPCKGNLNILLRGFPLKATLPSISTLSFELFIWNLTVHND